MCKFCSNLKRVKEKQLNDLMLTISELRNCINRWRKVEYQDRQVLERCYVYVPDDIKLKIEKILERSVI